MSELPWVRFFPSDWLGGTRGMTAAEAGIYITLIASMYERGAPVPEDHARLSRLCGATKATFRKTLDVLVDEGKVLRVDGGLWNKKVAKECGFRAEKTESARSAAEARWGRKPNKNNDGGNADAMRPQCDGNANQKPEPDSTPSGVERGRATRLPPDWTLPSEWEAWAVAEGHPSPKREAEKFRDYWIGVGGAKGRKADWQATWRNWIRRSMESGNGKQSGSGGGGGKPAVDRTEARRRALAQSVERLESGRQGSAEGPDDAGREDGPAGGGGGFEAGSYAGFGGDAGRVH